MSLAAIVVISFSPVFTWTPCVVALGERADDALAVLPGDRDDLKAGGELRAGLDDGLEDVIAVVTVADAGEVRTSFAAGLVVVTVAADTLHDGVVLERAATRAGVSALETDAEGRERVWVLGQRGVAVGEKLFHARIAAERGRLEQLELRGGRHLAGGQNFCSCATIRSSAAGSFTAPRAL